MTRRVPRPVRPKEARKGVNNMVSANIPNSTRKAVYRRDGWQCALCGCHDTLQIHHVVPRGEGGSDFPENLITLCSKCHAQAHGIDVYPGVCTQEDVEQACIEYVADYYAGEWYPYK